MPVPTEDKLIIQVAEAIAHHEGYYCHTHSVAKRNNNPGNLRSWGNFPIVDGFVDFPTRRDGFQALRHQVQKNLIERKLSLREFFAGKDGVYAGYAPATDNNDPVKYANFVATFLEERGFFPVSIDLVVHEWFKREQGNDSLRPTNPQEEPIITHSELPLPYPDDALQIVTDNKGRPYFVFRDRYYRMKEVDFPAAEVPFLERTL